MEGSADRAARVYSTSTICIALQNAIRIDSQTWRPLLTYLPQPSRFAVFCKLEYGKL